MGREEHGDAMLLKVRGIEDRQGNLAMNEVHMDNVWLYPLTHCLEFLFSLIGIDKRGSSGDFLRERRGSIVILCRNK